MKLKLKDMRGSRLRCMLLTGLPQIQVGELLAGIASPASPIIGSWVPRGLMNNVEAQLDKADGLLDAETREILFNWWLAANRKARTPNWDIASKCTIEGKRGLILIEAKAHDDELSPKGKDEPSDNADSKRNHEQIARAIDEANQGLNNIIEGWALSRNSHYQLCNRFAWSWKLASLGIPVVLVYLGFLNANEMYDQGNAFTNTRDWSDCIKNHAAGIVPDGAWNRRLEINSTPIWFLIRSMELSFKLVE